MVSNQLPGANNKSKARTAAILRRIPFAFSLGMWLVRRLHLPHFTAGVAGVVIDDRGRVLLLEHVYHLEHPWGLPGGWIDRREQPTEALIRELREETGLQVTVECPLFIRAHPTRTHFDFIYLCRPHGDIQFLSGEILSYKWADPTDLPPVSRFHSRAIAAAQTLPTIPTTKASEGIDHEL